MHRRESDLTSEISVDMKSTTSQARLAQLASARKLAVESRKVRQQERLEAKLSELRGLGDVSNDYLSRVCRLLIASEQDGRKRSNSLMTDINTNYDDMTQELQTIRHMLERVLNIRSSTPVPVRQANPPPPPPSMTPSKPNYQSPSTHPAHQVQRRPSDTVSSASSNTSSYVSKQVQLMP